MHINVIGQNHKGMIQMRRFSKRNKAALLYARSSLAIEGIHLTARENQLLLERSNGRMKNSEFLARALKIAKNV